VVQKVTDEVVSDKSAAAGDKYAFWHKAQGNIRANLPESRLEMLDLPPACSYREREMDVYFLIFSLFFPRIVLLVFLLLYPQLYPANSVPQWADLLLGIFMPRVLILIYIYQNMGADNVWFIAHLVVMILAYFGGGRETRRRRRRREV
jgi:hypothetical protein